MNEEPTAIPNAPPIERPAAVRQAVWPMVLGVLAMIVAGVDTLGYVFGVLALVVMMSTSAGFDLSQLAGPAYADHPWLSGGIILFDLAMLVLLYVAAIGLMRRRRIGVTSARVFAVMLGVFAVLNATWSLLNFDKFRGGDFAQLPDGFPIEVFVLGSTVLSLMVGLCVVVAVLAWFGSNRAKREWLSW
jgi:hypothetical protein